MTSLFDPITLGAIEAPNRIMMAPLTRSRATRSRVPTSLMGDRNLSARPGLAEGTRGLVHPDHLGGAQPVIVDDLLYLVQFERS
jgi:2,4-dienoyl-CoA reductase-like NADH-dependent reductase (Old Yellow Enzyme family)